MRFLFSVLICAAAACAPAADPAPQTIPPGAIQLKFTELQASLCGAEGVECGGASRPLLAGVQGVAFSADGTQVSLNVEFWHLTLRCDFVGCTQAWERKPRSLCYAIEGTTVTPSTTGCPGVTLQGGPPQLTLAGPFDGLTADHSLRRAVLGVPNAESPLLLGAGARLGTSWLGDLSAQLVTPNAWDLSFTDEAVSTRQLAVLVTEAGPTLLLPPPDGVKLSQGLVPQEEARVFWTNQADDVFALTLDDSLRLDARRVRTALTKPQAHTVGVREVGADVVTAVTTASSTSISGLFAGEVIEVSLLRTPRRDEPAHPLYPFVPFTAHAASSQSVMVCFTQPLDPTTLTASQFSLAGVEVKSVAATSVPQCARLATAPLPRNASLVLTVDGVTARSQDIARGVRLSVIAPDVVPVPGALRVVLPGGVKGVFPLSDESLLVTTGAEVARIDVSGVAAEALPSSMGAPNSASFLYVRPDPSVRGLWVMFQRGLGPSVISLQTEIGAQELGGSDVLGGGALGVPAGDGTLLVNAATGPELLRLSPSARVRLPRVTGTNFRGVFGAGKVLIEDAGRLQVLTLPDTLEAPSFAVPAGVVGNVNGPAFESEGSTYWCANGRLYRLADLGSVEIAPCRELERDARGVLWASDFTAGVVRVQGLTMRAVTARHPYDATKTLQFPHFKGGAVWFDNDTLRLEPATWQQLAGETP